MLRRNFSDPSGAPLDGQGADPYSPASLSNPAVTEISSVLKTIFTWWNGATPGALLTIAKRARYVGKDEFGNRYYAAKTIRDGDAGRQRRYVIYKGYAEPSKVPAEWHGWLHHTFAEPPTVEPLLVRAWEKPHIPNLSGTQYAWRPRGSILRSGKRPAATGDYQPWNPE